MRRKREDNNPYLKYMNEKLKKQLDFLIEIDKMKSIIRRSYIADGSKREDDAEHSWHLAMCAMIFSEYMDKNTDVNKVIKLVLIHDLVELYAGDTFAFDVEGGMDKVEREQNSADKLFGILPEEQGKELRVLWDEFEECESKESKYANMIDRLQPLLLDYANKGKGIEESNITEEQLRKRNEISLNEGPEEFKEIVNYIIKQFY
ncbi:MAG: HD domain-containing protein [Clostridiaceae bacterium]|nr:HD domain-containing protein [Clostridiaceae bacterium]